MYPPFIELIAAIISRDMSYMNPSDMSYIIQSDMTSFVISNVKKLKKDDSRLKNGEPKKLLTMDKSELIRKRLRPTKTDRCLQLFSSSSASFSSLNADLCFGSMRTFNRNAMCWLSSIQLIR